MAALEYSMAALPDNNVLRRGHSSIAITGDVCSHVTPSMQAQAAAAVAAVDLAAAGSDRVADGLPEAAPGKAAGR